MIKSLKKLFRPLKRWWYKRKLEKGKNVLFRIDHAMTMLDFTRKQRRRFWREFIKGYEFREDFLVKLKPEDE